LVVDPFDERTGGLEETIAGEGTERMKGFGRSLPQQIARILREEIIERKLLPGSKLPEPALVDRFETSRAPIREALYLLAQEGLIERTPRKGALVKGYARQEISELYRVRITLEEELDEQYIWKTLLLGRIRSWTAPPKSGGTQIQDKDPSLLVRISFRHKVSTLVAQGRLEQAEADTLIAGANEAIDNLSALIEAQAIAA
jgi:DNA-binding transcriptional MocR family regulator